MAALEKLRWGKNFIVYKNGEEEVIKIENIRFSYPHFGEMQEQENEQGQKEYSWGGVAMLPKLTHLDAKTAFMELLTKVLNAHIKDGKLPIVEPQNRCIKNGNDKEDENMHGHWLISFKEKDKTRRPSVREAGGGIMAPEKVDENFYGGCWGSVLLRPWYFAGKSKSSTKNFPKRLCCGFTGVQFVKDDKAFGQGRIDDTEAWGAVSTADSMGGRDDLDDV